MTLLLLKVPNNYIAGSFSVRLHSLTLTSHQYLGKRSMKLISGSSDVHDVIFLLGMHSYCYLYDFRCVIVLVQLYRSCGSSGNGTWRLRYDAERDCPTHRRENGPNWSAKFKRRAERVCSLTVHAAICMNTY